MPSEKKMMACGHAENGTCDGKPCCVICMGTPESMTEAVPPNLERRTAICPYCKSKVQSDMSLAFFEYRPGKDYDSYYCGCRGWD